MNANARRLKIERVVTRSHLRLMIDVFPGEKHYQKTVLKRYLNFGGKLPPSPQVTSRKKQPQSNRASSNYNVRLTTRVQKQRLKGWIASASRMWVSCAAIGNPERHVRKASHRGSKQQSRSPDEITLSLLVRATYIYFCSSRTSRSRWITQSTQHHRRGCNTCSAN